MRIERVVGKQLEEVVHLIRNVFLEYEAPDYSEEGVQAFFDTALYNENFMESLTMYGAYQNEEIRGVIATRNSGRHIALFFVDGRYQGRGIGRKLFETILEDVENIEDIGDKEITVNSSPYAREIYRCLGFEEISQEQIITGIRFIPMVYKYKTKIGDN